MHDDLYNHFTSLLNFCTIFSYYAKLKNLESNLSRLGSTVNFDIFYTR